MDQRMQAEVGMARMKLGEAHNNLLEAQEDMIRAGVDERNKKKIGAILRHVRALIDCLAQYIEEVESDDA